MVSVVKAASDTLVPSLRNANLEDVKSLEALAAPSLYINAARTSLSNLPLGATRFGGSPDVPEPFDWPRHRERPLTFLAQIALAELHVPELPKTGWLLFFYDVAETPMGFDPLHRGGARVFYVDTTLEQLRRIEHPDVTSAGGPFEACTLQFTPHLTLPDWEDRVLETYRKNHPVVTAESYQSVVTAFNQRDRTRPHHQLLGHPALLNGDMRGQCALVSQGIYCGDSSGYQSVRAEQLLREATNDWVLLLQLDNDELGPEWLWGDEGRVCFFIKRADLTAQHFDQTWLVLQCSG
jgi:uncharacterized protein YwqG